MESERLKAKRKLESKQRQFRERQYGMEETYDRGDDRLVREFDRYEEDEEDYDFGKAHLSSGR